MSPYPYNLTVEERSEYLYACVEAETITLEIVVDYVNRLARLLRESRYKRLAFVSRTPLLLPTDAYAMVAMLAVNLFPKGSKIALIDENPEHVHLKESVSSEARAAGLDVKAFAEFDEGEKWLLNSHRG